MYCRIFIPVGDNRPAETLELHKKVMTHFGLIDYTTYAHFPFPSISHGTALNHIVNNVDTDCYIFMENDSIPTNKDFLKTILSKISDDRTIFGQAQQSNHLFTNGTNQHVYAGPGCLAFTKKCYNDLGRPTLDFTSRSDCAEELTWVAKEKGYNLCFVYPSDVLVKNCSLDNGLYFGLGNQYGDLFYHAMQQSNPLSQTHFEIKCKTILEL